MPSFLTPEELAQQLKIEVEDVMSLIEEGTLPAIRIGNNIRIRDEEVDKLDVTCAAVPNPNPPRPSSALSAKEVRTDGSRWCLTRTGRTKFRVLGSIATGADIWPGQMQYPIKFPKQFMDAMLKHFHNAEVPVGGKFDDAGRGSLGEFIQQKLQTKMNPAVYLAALLIDEGYADPAHRGYIQFRRKRRAPLSAAATHEMLQKIREVRDLANLGKDE
jgi:excisionase family DNA binding protein